jgi:benzodiazapine receptor
MKPAVSWVLLALLIVIVPAIGFAVSYPYTSKIKTISNQSSLTPPPAVFTVVWTLLYALIGVAIWYVSVKSQSTAGWVALGFIVVQLAINYAWTPVFTSGNNMRTSALMIVAMLMLTGVAIVVAGKVSVVPSAILSVYFAWLIFALILTAKV